VESPCRDRSRPVSGGEVFWDGVEERRVAVGEHVAALDVVTATTSLA
jgi:hypothetical protein